MDPTVFDDVFQAMHCAKETSVQYFDSRSRVSDGHLNDDEFSEKLSALQSLVRSQPIREQNPPPAHEPAPFVLISAKGDPIFEDRHLQISTNSLRALLDAGIFPPHLISVYQESQSHFSHRVEYGVDNFTPIALYIFLRVPRIGRIINLSLRISLPSLCTIALLTSCVPASVTSIRSRCIRQLPLLQAHPLHILNFVFERRMHDFEEWVNGLWKYVGSLERKTGIGRRWSAEGGGVKGRKLEIDEYGELLQDLHGAGVELRLAQTTMGFACDLGPGFRKVMGRLEELRLEVGGGEIKRGVGIAWEDQVNFNETVVRTTLMKFKELIDRVQAQINVTYSLIAQKNSEQNIEIARLTAKDSQTMKTITVLTLTFLPSTMLASLWDAGIFTLDPDKSWRIYVGSTCALTIVVFAFWFLYVWVTRTRAPVSLAMEAEAKKPLV